MRLCCLFLTLFCGGIVATVAGQSTYDLQFVLPQVDCATNQFCATLQIKSADSDSMALGSYTVFWQYNVAAINHPVYTALHFSDNETCTPFGTSPYIAAAFGVDTLSGEANITTLMTFPNFGCPLINTTEWTTMGLICFDIVNPYQPVNMTFNADLTIINLNSNLPQHIQGSFSNLTTLPICETLDTDSDGLTDLDEIALGTNPNNADTDGDTLSDGTEINGTLTNPLLIDSNGNGILDGDEDNDNDGLSNLNELNIGTNPNNADTDDDTLSDGAEIAIFSNPLTADTDADGVPDSTEAPNAEPIDTDADNLYDISDSDDDDDGVATINEDANLNGDPTDDDDDNDSIPDYLDTDPVGISPTAVLQPYFAVHNSGGDQLVATLQYSSQIVPMYLQCFDINGRSIAIYPLHWVADMPQTLSLSEQQFGKGAYIFALRNAQGAVLAVAKCIVN